MSDESKKENGFRARIMDRIAPRLTIEERLAVRQSRVRTLVTHSAAGFLFAGGALLIGYLIVTGNGDNERIDKGIDLFQAILPVAASIVSFWFAGRVHEKQRNNQ